MVLLNPEQSHLEATIRLSSPLFPCSPNTLWNIPSLTPESNWRFICLYWTHQLTGLLVFNTLLIQISHLLTLSTQRVKCMYFIKNLHYISQQPVFQCTVSICQPFSSHLERNYNGKHQRLTRSTKMKWTVITWKTPKYNLPSTMYLHKTRVKWISVFCRKCANTHAWVPLTRASRHHTDVQRRSLSTQCLPRSPHAEQLPWLCLMWAQKREEDTLTSGVSWTLTGHSKERWMGLEIEAGVKSVPTCPESRHMREMGCGVRAPMTWKALSYHGHKRCLTAPWGVASLAWLSADHMPRTLGISHKLFIKKIN